MSFWKRFGRRGKVLDSELMDAVWNEDEARVRAALAGGANPNARDEKGGTSMHRAAWRGNLRIMALLFTHDADIKAKDSIGQEPKVYALAEGHWKAQRLLDWLDCYVLNGDQKPEGCPYWPES